ncbi:MAG TPA: FecR domain-containing protein, partial [Caulobacteraceae bacterium]
MKTMHTVSRLALAAAAAVAMTLPAAAAENIGVNAAIKNEVRLKTSADTSLRPAVLREKVSLGDQVTSGPNSALQVLLIDKSMFTVGANARMTFDRFVYDPNRGTSEVAASVAKGAFRFMSGKTQANARKTINTPVGTIGVRGTIVEGVVGSDVLEVLSGEGGLPALGGDPEALGLIVLRGPSRKTSGFDTPGLIDVTLGDQVVPSEHPGEAILSVGGHLFGPFELSDSAFDKLSNLLRTAPTGPNDDTNLDVG